MNVKATDLWVNSSKRIVKEKIGRMEEVFD